jgi:hypothetical protein
MSVTNKQIYIPAISIKGSFVEEVGGADDKIMYPGPVFDISLSSEDFQDSEEYHTTWINITRAVKTKLSKDAIGKSS